MKQAIEWIKEQSSNPPREGSLEMKAMLEAVQAIQIDAWRQGMTDAAELSKDSIHGGFYVFVPTIIATRDSTKTV